MAASSSEPKRLLPAATWQHYQLFEDVKEAIYSLPFYFKTETVIAGVMATDIFTLNAALGATIEEQVVKTLNDMRPIWDSDEKYQLYGFVRQAQTFPDVLLKRLSPPSDSDEIVLGIELKGWYLLAKEGEPSFRFQVTPSACNPQDLIVVVPWALSNVISGSPKVFTPYVEAARYAAEYRNYHWQHLRQTTASVEIDSPRGVKPYPSKADRSSDKPVSDSGKNFGRFARTGLMDDYLETTKTQLLAGIEARHWLAFFKAFQEQKTSAEIRRTLEAFSHKLGRSSQKADEGTRESVGKILDELERLVARRG